MQAEGLDWPSSLEQEPDAGLGNGGLGRLAACFIDSLATLQISGDRLRPALRVRHLPPGHRQRLPGRTPRQLAAPRRTRGRWRAPARRVDGAARRAASSCRMAARSSRPIGRRTCSACPTTGRWSATAARRSTPCGCGARRARLFDFGEFSARRLLRRRHRDGCSPRSLTRVLYPDDSTRGGPSAALRAGIFPGLLLAGRHRRALPPHGNDDWTALPDKVAIQLNDTHPAMAVAELMRILLDQAQLGWDEAWDLTVRTLAYTNHTLLPEALEKWPVELFETLLPRHLEIIYEINRRFLDDVRALIRRRATACARMSLIEEAPARQVRMAHLAIVGSHSTNGVAADPLATCCGPASCADFAELFPERFNNKTNGVTPRRWLLLANPELAGLITEAIGDGWVTDLGAAAAARAAGRRRRLSAPRFRAAKQPAKVRFAAWLKATRAGGRSRHHLRLPDQAHPRVQAAAAQRLHIVVLYNRLRADPAWTCRRAPSSSPARRRRPITWPSSSSSSSTTSAGVIDADPGSREAAQGGVPAGLQRQLAERLIPASDVSEQISTAGYEASGTSNMKFMMNGALTVGTRDGATIEMAEEAGEENFFLFGLTAEQVADSRGWYDPRWHYGQRAGDRDALDLIFSITSAAASRASSSRSANLAGGGDYYMHLADLALVLGAGPAATRRVCTRTPTPGPARRS